MNRNGISIFTLTLTCVLICVFAGYAHAEPLGKLKTMFDDTLSLFLSGIIPGLAIAVIAWTGIMIAMGRKSLVDSVTVLAGAGVALFAGPIVDALRNSGS